MRPVADSMAKRYGYGPGRMTVLPGCVEPITEDTKPLKKIFLVDLKMLCWCTIAGRVIFRQMFRPTSFAQLICSGNLTTLKKGIVIVGLPGSENLFLMALN